MGGRDKAFLTLGGETLAARAVRRLARQLPSVAISSNADASAFAGLGCFVLPDRASDRRGPLAGVEAGLAHARDAGLPGIVTVAVDTPFFPGDLAARLIAESKGMTAVALAATGDGLHPTCGFWPVTALGPVSARLAGGDYRLGRLAEAELDGQRVTFAGDGFFNVNTPADLVVAETMLAGRD